MKIIHSPLEPHLLLFRCWWWLNLLLLLLLFNPIYFHPFLTFGWQIFLLFFKAFFLSRCFDVVLGLPIWFHFICVFLQILRTSYWGQTIPFTSVYAELPWRAVLSFWLFQLKALLSGSWFPSVIQASQLVKVKHQHTHFCVEETRSAIPWLTTRRWHQTSGTPE